MTTGSTALPNSPIQSTNGHNSPPDNLVSIGTRPRLAEVERKIAEMLLASQTRREIATALGCSVWKVNDCLKRMYEKFGIRDDGIHCRIVRLALLIHERRAELGVRCEACGKT